MDIGQEQKEITVVPVDAPMFVPNFEEMPDAPADPMDVPQTVPASPVRREQEVPAGA